MAARQCAVYTVSIAGVPVEVRHKAIRHVHVRVHPPDGSVRVSAPLNVDRATVRRVLEERTEWITRHRTRIMAREELPDLRYESGEHHAFLGRRYRLDVREAAGTPTIHLSTAGSMILTVRPGSGLDARRRALESWYRRELSARIPSMLDQWIPVVGESPAEVRIKRMKTRWGTCNTVARRVWLNLELIRKPRRCIEYVLVHELTHLLERGHNARFYALMDKAMPDWRSRREELNATGLSHEMRGT